MPLITITQPAIEPVSVAEVLDAFHSESTLYNAQAAIIIKSLRKHAEARIGRALITQTIELVIDRFPDADIDLLLPNVQSITSVKYIDKAGAEQTMANNLYSLDSASTPSWLLPAYGTSWPETLDAANSLRVRFNVGYGDSASDVPEEIRLWIIVHATQMLGSPDGLVEQSYRPLPFVDRLLDPYIVYHAC